MRFDTSRCNIYLLASGRVLIRRKKFALSGGARIAAGVHPQELARIRRLFIQTADNGLTIMEAIGPARDGRPGFSRANHRALVKIYRERIRRLSRGERVGPAMLEAV